MNIKPTAVQEAKGYFVKNPDRKRPNEPKPSGELGNAPSSFSKEEKKIWKELKKIAPPNVLGNCDRWTIELACVLMVKLRSRSIKPQETQQLLSVLSKLGMTPADRARVAVIPQEPEKANDPWADFEGPTQ